MGPIGPQLGLSLVQSIVIMVIGQAAGTLIFGVFTLMGKRTGVSQFALGRMAFGRRGNNIPSIINGLIILAWTGLKTYVVLSLAAYCLHRLGLPNNRATEYSVAAVIMIIQLTIGTLGVYAIRTFGGALLQRASRRPCVRSRSCAERALRGLAVTTGRSRRSPQPRNALVRRLSRWRLPRSEPRRLAHRRVHL